LLPVIYLLNGRVGRNHDGLLRLHERPDVVLGHLKELQEAGLVFEPRIRCGCPANPLVAASSCSGSFYNHIPAAASIAVSTAAPPPPPSLCLRQVLAAVCDDG
jgi:hypothetical protein